MASISLHRASRILDAITKAMKASEPRASVKLSVFVPSLRSEIDARKQEATDALERVRRLLSARTAIRAVVAKANAQTGISDLLAEKAELDDLIAAIERLPGVAPQPKPEPEDEYVYRRRSKKPAVPAILEVDTVVSVAEAAKARYAQAAGEAVNEIEIATVDASGAAELRRQVVAAKRRLDKVSDDLRALNAATSVEVPDEHMDWLAANDVV